MAHSTGDGAEVPEFCTLLHLMDRITRRVRQLQRQTAHRSGLTPTQLAVLQVLSRNRELSQAQLASLTGSARPTMTLVVDALERRRLAVRELDWDDRRRLLVHLTEDGSKLLAMVPESDQRINGRGAGLSPSECRQLGILLKKLHENLEPGG